MWEKRKALLDKLKTFTVNSTNEFLIGGKDDG